MTLTSGFWDSVANDRLYNAVQFSRLFEGIISDGIFQGVGSACNVSANGTMTLTVAPGRGWFNNFWVNNDANEPIVVDDAHPTLNRIDTVVFKVDTTTSVRAIVLEIVKGTPSATPVAPTLTDTATTFYHPLCNVYVAAGDTTLVAGDLTNRIGTDTPFITGILDTSDMTWLFAQWDQDFSDWFDTLVDQLTGTQVTNLQNQIDDLADQRTVNIIRNYPSMFGEASSTPREWNVTNATLVQVLASTAGITLPPNKKLFKMVTSSADGEAYQSFAPASEAFLNAGSTMVSAGVWVYSATAGTVTFALNDSSTGEIDSDTTTAVNVWTYLQVRRAVLGANNLEFSISHSATSATVYFANPTLNVGSSVDAFGHTSLSTIPGGRNTYGYSNGTNLWKNYPQIEKEIGGSAPDWYGYSNLTHSETDPATESITGWSPNNIIVKGVTSAADGYLAQYFLPANEDQIIASQTALSVGMWIYNKTTGTVTLEAYDDPGGTPSQLAYVTTTATNQWVYIEITGFQVGANQLGIFVRHSATSATFYIANPMINVGPAVLPWKPRGLQYIESRNSCFEWDPAGVYNSFTDYDMTTYTHPNAVKVEIMLKYKNTTAANRTISYRRNGSTATIGTDVLRNRDMADYWFHVSFTCLLDSYNKLEIKDDAPAGDNEYLSMMTLGYWRWEG